MELVQYWHRKNITANNTKSFHMQAEHSPQLRHDTLKLCRVSVTHGSKRKAQILNNSSLNTPIKPSRTKISKGNNAALTNSVIDLKARSMRNNLIFYNIQESDEENTTEKILSLMEEKLVIKDAKAKVKIDRSHRLGRKRSNESKPRPIVVKFNFYQDKVSVLEFKGNQLCDL